MLTLAKAGKRNGYLMEGMGCPGGCIGGAGTLTPLPKAQAATKQFQNGSTLKIATQNPIIKEMDADQSILGE